MIPGRQPSTQHSGCGKKMEKKKKIHSKYVNTSTSCTQSSVQDNKISFFLPVFIFLHLRQCCAWDVHAPVSKLVHMGEM